jgi:hypothetical protein
MQTFLVRLGCRSPYLTPWRNCTLWGRLTWIVADGRLPRWSIEDWIEYTREGIPPLVVGDAFPFDAVPVPATYQVAASGPMKRPKTLPWTDWLRLCQAGKWPADGAKVVTSRAERMHVVIGRDTGTTVEGGLRTESGEQPAKGLLIVAQVDDALGERGLRTLIDELCMEGWGQGRTYGYGHIRLDSITPIDRPEPTGWSVTLGHCHPTDDLPEDGYWRWAGVPVRRHDPQTRMGPIQEFTAMLSPGATFAADRDWIGTSLQPADRPNYLHYGLAPTWPVAGVTHG